MPVWAVALSIMVGLFLAAPAHAQAVFEQASIDFGRLIVPGSGGMIQIDPDNTVSMGNNLILSPSVPRRGRYRITGSAGLVDISVTNVATCDGTVSLNAFPAIWGISNFNNIEASPITGEAFDGDEVLYLGARLSYSNAVTLAPCAMGFDLNIVTY